MTTPATASRTTSDWTFDTSHTLVEFSARHMMITTVKGRMAGVRGTITIDEAHPERSTVAVEIDAASIDTHSEQRDAHLRSADFLDVEQHPTLTFQSRRVEGARAATGTRFRVIGELTIRGTTREVSLDAVLEGRGRDPWGGERVSFSADTRVDRRDFGLVWNQTLEAGGLLVSDEIRIHLQVQAVRTA
jgi:polyisoprenoid-binding protein YceI